MDKSLLYDRLEKKAAEALGWEKVPGSCYDGAAEVWVEATNGKTVPVGSARQVCPMEELIRRYRGMHHR